MPTITTSFVFPSQDTVSSDEDVVQAVNAERFPDGQPVTLEAIFGTSITYDDEGRVEAASALSLVRESCATKQTIDRVAW